MANAGDDSKLKPSATTAGEMKPRAAEQPKGRSEAQPEARESKGGEAEGKGSAAGGGGGATVAPMPSIPTGGGAIRGIGEKFSANPVTGTASFQIPIVASAGRAGFHPELGIAYDSGAGNGPFGHGFSLSVPHVSRKTDKGLPSYLDLQDSDVFILSGAEDLVPKLHWDTGTSAWVRESFTDTEAGELVTRYAPRVEGAFVRIEKRTPASGPAYWQATTHDNVTSTYGKSAGARVAHPRFPSMVFTWLLEETRDDKGNVIKYVYKADDNANDTIDKLVNVPDDVPWEANRLKGLAPVTQKYLKRIFYGNVTPGDATDSNFAFEVVFDYGEHDTDAPAPDDDDSVAWPVREDPFSTYRAGFEIRTYRLCRRVLMFHHMTELGAAPCLVASTDLTYTSSPILTQLVSATHSGYIRNTAGTAYTKKSHPPVDLAYSQPTLHTNLTIVPKKEIPDLPIGVQGPYQWVDLDGEGLPGVLAQHGTALTYKQNLGGGKLAPARTLVRRPTGARLGSGGQQIADIDGDGEKELVFFEGPAAGYHDRIDGDWGPFRPFPSQPMIDWADPNLRFVDLTGDGLEDILIAWYGNDFLWFKSLGKSGYAVPVMYHKLTDEEKAPGPRVVFADEVQTIFLADMTGDGLTDIVRVLNGNVCYWPNIGHGRFGAKVQMGGAMHFDYPNLFDPRRIRLADIDGTGTADILYIHARGIKLYRNQAGNSFAAPVEVGAFPDHSDASSIAVIDMLGTGTACLVWSTSLPGHANAPMRYLDLLGSSKPYLLKTITNNLGLVTSLEYTASTKLYREDAEAGKPWVTRLPFPVQTLTRTETYDAVSRHRFVTLYKYHHGYFDGVEREFRGFGMVEQWDTESWSAFSGMGDLPPPANATDPEFHKPPTYTKTWFHTGAWKVGQKIEEQYKSEYFQGDPLAVLLPDTILPSGLSLDEKREATRALKGQILRQEVYAQDGSDDELLPYMVSERSYDVRRVQPVIKKSAPKLGTEGKYTHGVFFAHPREAIEYHYERVVDDPRITHAFTLAVDPYGVVTRSAMVGYPRRDAKNTVPYAEQAKVAVTLTEVDVFHHPAPTDAPAPGWYRIGVPIESRTYELTGFSLTTDALFTFTDIEDAVATADAASELRYEDEAPASPERKRILGHTQVFYKSDDQTTVLALGEVESLALPHKSYTKAFSPNLVSVALDDRADGTILAEGGYVQFEIGGDWWVPSGRQHFDAAHFYLPDAFYDPFGNTTSVVYDTTYSLFVTSVTDPVGNVVQAAYDHRTLAPSQVTDPNGNRAAAAFDELGMVVATAVMGKAGGSDGDTLEDPTSTFAYDLNRYRTTGKPNVVHGRARERHGDSGTPWQESYGYSDGSGHEVMRKIQAEPGLAPERDSEGALVHDTEGALVMVATDPRWVGTGRTVFDNKGNPIKQYEPFFSGSYEYEDEAELVEWGVTPILHYDGLGRLIRTDLPNGTYSKVVFSPWEERRYDPNDTVEDSLWYAERSALDTSDPERRAADKAFAHRDTPSVVHVDSLGRPFLTIEDNGGTEQYGTRVALDVEGNALSIADHRGVVVQESAYGMGGHKLYQKSCDAGERWMLGDIAGTLLRAWDGRGFTRRAAYDAARRVTHLYVTPEGEDEMLVEYTVYGEALSSPAALNHRGRVYQHYDGAGVVTSVAFDFKGNLLQGQRQIATVYDATVDWIALDALTDPAAIAAAASSALESETFTTATVYDALNRPTSITTPDASEIRPGYNEAGLLEKVDVRIRDAGTWTAFVADIDYDAKGQREQIVYGASATTTKYSYDPLTFRMIQLKTTRAAGDPGDEDDDVLQNLQYTYDPVGNITEVKDSAQQTVFFNDDVVLPVMTYTYDALYRLTQATGRELTAIASFAPDLSEVPVSLPHANDMSAVRNYTQEYVYDAVGNILQMVHKIGATPEWTRNYKYETTIDPVTEEETVISNRLIATSAFADEDDFSATYGYDNHGNMTSMPHLSTVVWNHRDEMASADLGGGGVVYFTYDSAGQRVRKVYEHSGLVEERIYLGGFEIYRKWVVPTGLPNELTLERETLHVMDGVQRIALVETKTVDTAAGGSFAPETVVRLQLGNHLGSAALEVDLTSAVISYEEYHPYGTTAYQSASGAVEVSRKRYRYTGKERDEETGLYYHGARYYAPWLGRWTAADPAGLVDGPGLYTYVSGNPIRLRDPNGTEGEDPDQIALRALQAMSVVNSVSLRFAPPSVEEFKAQRAESAAVQRAHKKKQATRPVRKEVTIRARNRGERELDSWVEAVKANPAGVKEFRPDAYEIGISRLREEKAEALRQRASAGGVSVRDQAASEDAITVGQLTLMALDFGLIGPGAAEEAATTFRGQEFSGGDCVKAARATAGELGFPKDKLSKGLEPGIIKVHERFPQVLNGEPHYAFQLPDGSIVDRSLLGNIETYLNRSLPAAERAALSAVDTFTEHQYATLLNKYFSPPPMPGPLRGGAWFVGFADKLLPPAPLDVRRQGKKGE